MHDSPERTVSRLPLTRVTVAITVTLGVPEGGSCGPRSAISRCSSACRIARSSAPCRASDSASPISACSRLSADARKKSAPAAVLTQHGDEGRHYLRTLVVYNLPSWPGLDTELEKTETAS